MIRVRWGKMTRGARIVFAFVRVSLNSNVLFLYYTIDKIKTVSWNKKCF